MPFPPKPKRLSLRDYCYESLGEMYLSLNNGWDYVPYQQEQIIPALEGLERGAWDRLMVFIPSGHSKTEIGTKCFIPWYLGRNPGHNVILVAHTDPLAKDFGSHIRDTVSKSEVFKAVFPQCKVNSLNRASNFFRTAQNNSFYAFGMDGGVTGRRGDLLVMDDPVKDIHQALSAGEQDHLFATYQAVLKDRMRPNSKIMLMMTRWAVRDLAGRILESEGKRWKVLAIPAENENGSFLWESFYGRDRYLEAKEDGYIWQAKWMQSPAPQLAQGFQESWLRFYMPKVDSQGRERKAEARDDGTILSQPVDTDVLFRLNTYIVVDPAMGKTAAHDRSCILVLAAGPEHRWFLVDAVLDRIDAIERIDHLVRLARLWKPKIICYEEYALAADTLFLRLRLEDEGMTDLNVMPVGRKGIKGMSRSAGGRLTKTDRINQLVSDFRDARIWLPKVMRRTCKDGTELEIIGYFLQKEYLPWAGEGSVAHDDMLDALARIHDPEFEGVVEWSAPARTVEVDRYKGSPTGTSWESSY